MQVVFLGNPGIYPC